jgi:hypothetical protein
MTKLSELEELGKVSPVIHDDQAKCSYIYVQYSNLYLLALARNNVNAIAIIAFLHKLVEIFKHYFREVSTQITILPPPPPRSPPFSPAARGGVPARQLCDCVRALG